MLGRVRVVGLGRERECANAVILLGIPIVLIANCQGVVLAELVIDTRGEISSMVGIGHGFNERNLREGTGIERYGIDCGKIVYVPPLEVEEERRFLVDRPTDVAAEDCGIVTRLVGATEWIRRIEGRIVSID